MNVARGRSVRWGLLVLAGFAAYALWPTDERRIEGSLHHLARSLEERDVEKFMTYLSYNYSDNHGGSYLLVRTNLKRELPQYSDILVEMKPTGLLVTDHRAQVELGVRVSAAHGQDMGYFVGDFDNPARLSLVMEKRPPGRWVVLRASYDFL